MLLGLEKTKNGWKKEQKALHQAKNIFEQLKTDGKSILFAEEKIDSRIFKKFKKSSYQNDKILVKLIINIDNRETIIKNNDNNIPLRLNYIEKEDIDISTLLQH